MKFAAEYLSRVERGLNNGFPMSSVRGQVMQEAAAYITQLESQLRAADDLAAEVERRMNDLGGYDGRFPVRQALDRYKKERDLE